MEFVDIYENMLEDGTYSIDIYSNSELFAQKVEEYLKFMYGKWWSLLSILEVFISVAIPNAWKSILAHTWICLDFGYEINFLSSADWSSSVKFVRFLVLEIEGESISSLISYIVTLLIFKHAEKSFLFWKFNLVIAVDDANLLLRNWTAFHKIRLAFVPRMVWVNVSWYDWLNMFVLCIFDVYLGIYEHFAHLFATIVSKLGFAWNFAVWIDHKESSC